MIKVNNVDTLEYKKGVGAVRLVHPGAKGLRIAHITQDRQRS